MGDEDGTKRAVEALMELPQSPPDSPTSEKEESVVNLRGSSSSSRKRSHEPSPFSEMAAKLHRAYPGTPRTDSLQLSTFSPIITSESRARNRSGESSARRAKMPEMPVMMTYVEAMPDQIPSLEAYADAQTQRGREPGSVSRSPGVEGGGASPLSAIHPPSRHRVAAVPIHSAVSAAEEMYFDVDMKRMQRRGGAHHARGYYAVRPPPEAFSRRYISEPMPEPMYVYPASKEDDLDHKPFVLESFDSRHSRMHAPKFYQRVYVVHPDFEDAHKKDAHSRAAYPLTPLPQPSLRDLRQYHHFSAPPAPLCRQNCDNGGDSEYDPHDAVHRKYASEKNNEEEEYRKVSPSPPPPSPLALMEGESGRERLERQDFASAARSYRHHFPKHLPRIATVSTKKNLQEPRKCNCKNSKCLKLYCECFAAGRLCKDCNCDNCSNNDQHLIERQLAVQAILEKNPNAFREKISSAKSHSSGCHCVKSRCLKKYCECFEAGIYCGKKCKCSDCQNFPGSGFLTHRRDALPRGHLLQAEDRPVFVAPSYPTFQVFERY